MRRRSSLSSFSMRILAFASLLSAAVSTAFLQGSQNADFRFVILGDRTGQAQPGVYEEALREAEAAHPDFIINVGDTIEGGNDATVDTEWQQVTRTLHRFAQGSLFFTPGNHDVWSGPSASAFERYTHRPLHYSFDFGLAHFAVLDNSRSDQFSPDEIAFLESDLQQHRTQPLKFVFSHRPSWILPALLGSPESAFQLLAAKYGVQYFVAGHVHQMLHFRVKNVTYLSMPSAGGHLRGNAHYESGWFFAQTLVTVHKSDAMIAIRELEAPFGQSRETHPEDWGAAGLIAVTSSSGAR